MHYNVAFYSDTYLPAVDGVVTSMLNFKKELERRGHKVFIFATCKMNDVKAYKADDVFLYPGVGFKPYPQYSFAVFPYHSMGKLKELGINIVHSQTPFSMGINGMLAAWLGRYPFVTSFHTLVNSRALSYIYPKNKMLKKFYTNSLWGYTQFFYRRCDMAIAPSHAIERFLKRHSIKGVTYVPNSVDLEVFNPRVDGDAVRRHLSIPNREKIILYLGRVSREKKIETMLRAAKTLLKRRSDMTFVIGGTGPSLDYYRRMTMTLGISDKVKFMGFVDQKVLPKLYAASDVLCLPSTFETQGIVSLEAMATGKPVVGADYMALRELIENGKNGERFKSGDYVACSRKIEKVLNNLEVYKKHALSTAKRFSVEKSTDRLLKAYDSVYSNWRSVE